MSDDIGVKIMFDAIAKAGDDPRVILADAHTFMTWWLHHPEVHKAFAEVLGNTNSFEVPNTAFNRIVYTPE